MSDDAWLFVVAVVPFYVGVVLAIVEVARRRDLTPSRKSAWIVLLILVSPVTLAVYAIARPPRHRAALAETAPGAERAEQVVDLVERHSLGELDDDGYRTAIEDLRRRGYFLSAGFPPE